jgi:hypothetical protein
MADNLKYATPVDSSNPNNAAELVVDRTGLSWCVFSSLTGSTAALIPLDNTIPQNTEGTEVLVLSGIEPRYSSSKIAITVDFPVCYASATVTVIFAVFADNDANAIAVGTARTNGASIPFQISNTVYVDSWVGSKTLKLRIGNATANTLYYNRANTANIFQGIGEYSMTVREIPQP